MSEPKRIEEFIKKSRSARCRVLKFRMSSIQNSLESVAKVMSKQIESVLKNVASRHNVENVDAFTMEVLSELGLVEVKLAVTKQKKEKKEKAVTLVVPTVEQPVVPTVAAESDSDGESEAASEVKSEVSTTVEKKKKPVVSKKMKEAFLALDGASEEKLKSVMKAYKEAENVSEWLVFARAQLNLPIVEVPVKEKKPRAKKEKKETKGRLDKWTPTSTKLFKTIVEENSGVLTDDLKKEFVSWLEVLTDEEYALKPMQGHMRQFSTVKFLKIVVPEINDDEEDQEEFDFEGEKLWIGLTSGKIFQQQDGVDMLIGEAGKGRFKEVKIPSV